jgi:hypothetical protein
VPRDYSILGLFLLIISLGRACSFPLAGPVHFPWQGLCKKTRQKSLLLLRKTAILTAINSNIEAAICPSRQGWYKK